mgnify:CR=1 FL=1
MRIRLLKEDYLSDSKALYQSFLTGEITQLLSDNEILEIPDVKPFPIYMADYKDEINSDKYEEAFKVLTQYYINLDRDIVMNKRFWDSQYFTILRDYILTEYPKIKKKFDNFKNVVIKEFDWENYVFKLLILIENLYDYRDQSSHLKYLDIVLENYDLFNYIIKYSLTRNGEFLLTILDIVEEENLSKILKAKIPNRPDLGRDERYGRRVIYEFNKNYPVLMFPNMDKEQIKRYFQEYLSMYYQPKAQ